MILREKVKLTCWRGKDNLDALLRLAKHDVTKNTLPHIRDTAKDIMAALHDNPDLSNKLPGLENRMLDILVSINRVECRQQLIPAPSNVAVADRLQSISSTQQFKPQLDGTKGANEPEAPKDEEGHSPPTAAL
ncbi:hypothetical protein BN59_00070 [Legionella massiliensis]|uniref:Uncharacterized protein n=1 Tax=Legionella massiliensis TaxID=1034943 RepID=A0A078KRT9_9GAMM|nr:hypothetical protein [Legionella massiliensis]CDZ75811.1 hypothetical protein BN59_00070 [Legionella massiliensis]CEE11549.1 hypothetical protein BN1094_00070 [Legionella massiliensis]